MSPRHWLGLGAVATTAALILSGCGSSISGGNPATDAGGPLNVGVIVPATGPISSAGLALEAGIKIGAQDINAKGGVNGKPMTYTVQDDGGDPARSTQIAKKYTQQGGISLLFGTITGDTAAAVTSVATNAKIPFATSILGDPSVCSAYAWGFGESIRQLLEPRIPQLIKQYGPRIAIVGSDYNFPHDYAAVAKGIIAKNGGTVVADEYSPVGTTDFESTIGRLRDSKPDVLLSMVVGADAIIFTKQAAAFGLLTPKLGFEGAPTDADYYPALTTLVDGRDKAVRWTDGFTDEESTSFIKAYRAEVGNSQPIPEVAANAYFAIKFIAAAANKAKTTNPQSLNKALGSFSYDSPLGKGTHFAGIPHILQADMFIASIKPGGAYAITKDLGPVPDTDAVCK